MNRIGKKRRRVRVDALLETQGNQCFWCHRPMVDAPVVPRQDCSQHMTLDHLIPVAKGGNHDLSNLVLACLACNQDRADSVGPYTPPWRIREVA
jgi:5-methylcytosine-specific restriction endonuclease McrA